MNKLFKFITIILHGTHIRDKAILAEYALRISFLKLLNKQTTYTLKGNVKITNKNGTYHCGSNMNAVWVVSEFHEGSLEHYYRLQEGSYVDIGANIGKFVVIAGKSLNSKGKVIAIEPEASNVSLLKKNIKANRLSNVIVEHAACSNKNGTATFYIKQKGTGGHSLVTKTNKQITVPAKKLDTILQRHAITDVRLVKIDVEGAEKLVLEGATKTLRKKPLILFESSGGKHLTSITSLLTKYGYTIKKIDADNYLAQATM